MNSFMKKHSHASNLLNYNAVDDKASALHNHGPKDPKTGQNTHPEYTKEDIEAIKQRVYNRNKRGDDTKSVYTESELAKDVRSGKVKKQ